MTVLEAFNPIGNSCTVFGSGCPETELLIRRLSGWAALLSDWSVMLPLFLIVGVVAALDLFGFLAAIPARVMDAFDRWRLDRTAGSDTSGDRDEGPGL